GPLFAVDLDVHEQAVHEAGDVLVLEGLALHHVAPVTRRVAHGEQHGLVLSAGAGERLVTPRIPVDGTVGGLEKGRARLPRQPVRVPMLGHAAGSTNGSAATFARRI